MSGHRDGVTRIGIGAALATILAGAATAGDGVDCPPNPRPGACYEKVLIQPMYQNGVLVRPGSFDWREIPCATGGSARTAPAGYVYAGDPAASARPGADIRVLTSPNLVRTVQTALAGRGYYRGPASGYTNDETERGLARFQADNRLRPGWTKETLRALGVPYPWGSQD